MKKKKLLLIGGGAILTIFVVLMLVFNKSSEALTLTSDNPEFAKYISAYTSGVVSKKSTIKIRLVSDLANKIKEKGIPANLIEIEGVKGRTEWFDESTLEFIPEGDLMSGKEFVVQFHLSKVEKVDEDIKDFNFKFETIKQNFEIQVNEQKTIDKKKLRWQKAFGTVFTADVEDTDLLSKSIKAYQNGKELKIKWIPSENFKKHGFEIDSISRSEKASEVTIEWNGAAMNVDKIGKTTIEIPSIYDFKFMEAKVIHSPEQYLQLQFSDPLNENQYINGLVRIEGVEGLRYIVEDNLIKVYPSYHLDGDYTLSVEEGIKNILGSKLKKAEKVQITFEKILPAVRFVNDGVILPSSDKGLIVSFEAVNLSAVDIQIVRIFENNITQFLQVNDFDGEYQLQRVGKPVLRKTVRLDDQGLADLGKWNRFSINLEELVKTEPGAIYRITVGFRKQHSIYSCGDEDEAEVEETNLQDITPSWGTEDFEASYWDGFEDYYYGGYYYNWEDRDDPCKDAYYGGRRAVSKNIIASDLGIIAKRGNDESMHVFITDLNTARPKAGVIVEIYDYTQQLTGKATTNQEGIAFIEKPEEPYFLVAKDGNQRGYLKLYDGASNSLSRFDISGVSVMKGTKGYIYGERGVWRPGDSLYITFVLEEIGEKVPESHPVIFELYNPQSQLVKRLVQPKNNIGFYHFRFATDPDAPTGTWWTNISIGGLKFSKMLSIETIKPNRLKISFDFPDKELFRSSKASGKLEVKWLHGAVAKSLEAKVDVVLSPLSTYFEKYKDFTFDDNTKYFYSESSTIFDSELDENGVANVSASFSTGESSSGKLKATFITKVFEKGGDFSVDQFSKVYHPYNSYVGLKAPKGDKSREMLLTDTTHTINIVIVDAQGNPVKETHGIRMEFYKIDWRWWYDQADGYSSYSSRNYMSQLNKEKIYSKNGKASWNVRVNYPDWGRYMVKAYDEVTGHSSSIVMFIDWPGWAGKAQREGAEGATMLMFNTDREKYNVGDAVNLTIPTSDGGRALISIESGSKVIQTHWLESTKGTTNFSFIATKDMTPNVYVNVTLIQPHGQTANDLPIRLYGVVPVIIEDPTTHLNPVITMPDVLQSESIVKVKVKEKNGKPMTYTIAMVDEGLLDLTRFETPDPWNHFYAREALGVKTWDIYDWVIGAGGDIERLLAIGGGGEMDEEGGSKKANRFKPMVRFYGPFELSANQSKTHKIDIPKYVGSVRTMVIAGKDRAYGSADKTTPVRKPLMLLGTLPRVLGPKEKVKLPVSVFAMEDHVKDVTVQLKTDKYLKIVGEDKKSLKFDKPGEDYVEFEIEVQPILGVSKVEILAWSGNEKASFEIEIDIRNPNPKITEVLGDVIEPGKSLSLDFTPVGIQGTNEIILEVSSMPPLNLGERIKYLIAYPHGCAEQTTSAAFPQLFLSDLMDLTKERKSDIERNVKAGIDRITKMQLFNGGIGYWPGASNSDEWCSNYAGHFILEAQKKGYSVPSAFLKKWKKYQQNMSKNWVNQGPVSQFTQAYRLYSLALSGSPEMGAMNRLREISSVSEQARWRLAAAYKIAGKDNIARKLIEGLSANVKDYNEMSYTYGSGTRDKAMILETLTLLGEKKMAYAVLKEISERLSSGGWYSTQTTAYSLVAVSMYARNNKQDDNLKYKYSLNGTASLEVVTHNRISQVEIPVKTTASGKIIIENPTKGVLFARLIMSGIPEIGDQIDSENDLRMTVVYKTMNGTVINPERIEQGTDFMAEVTVSHPGVRSDYKQMALTQIFPSGWEIINTRMLAYNSNYSNYSIPTYQDIRDDRVYTYFDLYSGKSKTFRILLNATYQGRYYLPTTYCEAMYDNTINSRKCGNWVDVFKP